MILVSKLPLSNKEYLNLDAFFAQRGMLYGEVDGVQIGCTHLSSAIPLPYGGNYGSWQG